MTYVVPADQIEGLVGAKRHSVKHLGRLSSDSTAEPLSDEWWLTSSFYILHSEHCKANTPDLRTCVFSEALDAGLEESDWTGYQGKTVVLAVDSDGILCPNDVALEREDVPPYGKHWEPIEYLDGSEH